MALYTLVGPAPGSKGPTLHVSGTEILCDAGEVVAEQGGFPKNFKNGSTKGVKATSLGNNVPVFVFIDGAGAVWIDDNAAGTNVPGDMWRAGRAWRDADGKFVVCQGDNQGKSVSYTTVGSPFSRRWVDDATSAGGFTIPDAPFQRHPSVTYNTEVVVSGSGTATVQLRNPKVGLVTKIGTFSGTTPVPTTITVGNEADVLEFMTSDAATKLRITILSAIEKL